jgi:hypothetical protein
MTTQTDFKWQDYAACNGIEDTNIFFDDYESDVIIAMNTDQVCMHCPVAKQCLQDGESTGSWGIWGGVYLVYGKIDTSKNSHKSDEDWKRLEQIHGQSFSEQYS